MNGYQGNRFVQFLNYSFPIGRVLGFRVRAHWTLILFLLYFVSIYSKDSPKDRPFSGLLLGTLFALMLYSIILIHELGHSVAARRLGIASASIILSPLGGLAGIGGRVKNPWQEFVVVFWGPIMHPILLLIGAPLYLLVETFEVLNLGYYGNWLVWQFFWINVVMFLFNMIPAFPMDGGRFLRAFLATKMYSARATRIAAYIGQAISIVFIICSVLWGGEFWFILTVIGISNIIICEQVKEESRHIDPYVEEVDDPYRLNLYQPEPGEYAQGRGGGRGGGSQEKKPGFFARWRKRRAEKRAAAERREREQQRAQRQRMRAQVDELLDKVSELGITSLTPEEHEFLTRASDDFKKE